MKLEFTKRQAKRYEGISEAFRDLVGLPPASDVEATEKHPLLPHLAKLGDLGPVEEWALMHMLLAGVPLAHIVAGGLTQEDNARLLDHAIDFALADKVETVGGGKE